ncbi:MAG: biotin synthase BioB [Candidatus Gastranaerophilales bacterium]|nr:biotin synthase BioB [Candidatus Gastranaerophilales bacterium]
MSEKFTADELLRLYYLPLDELLDKAAEHLSNNVEFCSLISARTGKCSQNCKYCAQSSHYNTDIETNPLVTEEDVLKTAVEARKNKATRFAVVTSGKRPNEEDFPHILKMIKLINSIEGLTSCASIGIITEEQAKALAEAGLNRFHHNINTCRSYYSDVCTTHTYQDRIDTIKLVKKYGMELCCGVILGMGESILQRIEMAMELAEIEPDSIPVNVLCPIKNTPFESYIDKIDEEHVLRTMAIFKIAVPNAIIRFAGGRKLRLTPETQKIALQHCVEGMIMGNMLTTIGIEPYEDIETVTELGKNIK